MKFFSIIASTIACAATVHSAALAQGTEQPATCTFTATPCQTLIGPTETITVYEQPFTSTATQSFDCQGCQDVTVIPRFCGLGVPIQTTTFIFDNAQATTTVDVCSPTPN